ncbi:MAG: hypothetical protein WBG46_00570 [Nonlabens sp.]
MKKYLFLLSGLVFLILISSCRNDFEFESSTGNLEFSQDTVFLDTVFSTIGSSTRTFKVYNRSDDDIVIPTVGLRRGEQSRYRLSVDGAPGRVFEDVELLAKDSMFIQVETTIDINDFSGGTDFLYEDQIDFDSGANLQTVELVTLVQDAIFLFPELEDDGTIACVPIGEDPDGNEICIEGFVLGTEELTFTNEKPYVIYGFAFVPNDAVMTVDPGARLHFHNNSGIIVTDNASIQVNGALSTTEDLENQVIFEGDRLEPVYSDVAGQWSTIWLTAGSKNNIFNYTTIKNSSVGLLVDSSNPDSNGATLQINNSQIYNCSNNGILATTGDIDAENLVIGNTGQSSFVGRFGGSYNFNNSTFANYWNSSFREDPVVLLSNTIPNATEFSADLTEANFTNCIIYGNRDLEIALLDDETSAFNFRFSKSLLRMNDRFDELSEIPAYDFSNASIYDSIIFNQDPLFKNVNFNEYLIDNTSPANGLADPATATSNDINGTDRGSSPDAGAYESTNLSEED